MKTYAINTLSNDTVELQRNDGITAHIRQKALELIPTGSAALLSAVTKILSEEMDVKPQTMYNYVRTATKKYLQKINGNVFIVNITKKKELIDAKTLVS